MRQAGMRLLKLLNNWRERRRPRQFDEWFHVEFDDERVRVAAQPPKKLPFEFDIYWREIRRIVFVAEGLYWSDWVCIISRNRAESYDIPIEADGGLALWEEILRRGLFDRALAGEANRSLSGRFEWPPAGPSPAA